MNFFDKLTKNPNLFFVLARVGWGEVDKESKYA